MTGFFKTARCTLPLGRKTYLVGILNLTPDSFSDGGNFMTMESAGANQFKSISLKASLIIDSATLLFTKSYLIREGPKPELYLERI